MPPTDEVYIWLGANVMLAYPMDEAETLLVERLGKAKKSLVDCEEDAEFLREQITVSRPLSTRVPGTACTHILPDHGGCDSQSVQLGRRAEAQGEGRGGEQREGRQGRWWLSGPARWGKWESQHRESYCRPVTAAHGEGRVQLKRLDPRAGCNPRFKGPVGVPSAEGGAEQAGENLEAADSGMVCSKSIPRCFPVIWLSALYDSVRPTLDTLSGRMKVDSGVSILECNDCQPVIFHI